MIDITTIQAFDIPPEIEVLQNENAQLLQQNEKLSQDSKTIIVVALGFIIIGGIIIFSLNNKKDEKKKKFN